MAAKGDMTSQCDFLPLAAAGIRALHPYQPGKPESELRRELGIDRIVKLASNENPWGPSPRALRALRDSAMDFSRYPDGNGYELKETLARHHDVSVECITLGNGSNDVLDMVARVFLTPEHEAVFSAHAFAVYPICTLAAGARPRVAAANPVDHPMPYGHDLAAMEALIGERTGVVFIANPNNPTGTWLTADQLYGFLERVRRRCLVVVDEAYWDYVTEPDYPNAIDWLDRFSHLIVTRTFSKAHGLAGLRVGYAISHPEVADLLNRVRQPFNVNTAALIAATAAVSDTDHLEVTRRSNLAGKRQLCSAFDEMGLTCLPSSGNFLCLNVGRPAQNVFAALLRLGVIVRPVDNYGLPNFLRVTVGREQENRRFLEALHDALELSAP
jgi:histidinol-phosphate aminotransferase